MHVARRIGLITAVASAFAASASPALAATEPASGTFVETPETITSAKFSGGNETYTLTRDAIFSGTYTGIGHAEQRIVIHSDGSANLQMTIDFEGIVCGEPTSLTFLVTATVDFAANTMDGTYSVIGDAGAPRGHGSFTGTPSTGGAYEGQLHCD
jgi:hypothetical protein